MPTEKHLSNIATRVYFSSQKFPENPPLFISLCSKVCFFSSFGWGQLVNRSAFHGCLASAWCLHRSQFPCRPALHPSLGTLGRGHGTGLLGLAWRLLRPGLMKGVRILGTGLEMSGAIRGWGRRWFVYDVYGELGVGEWKIGWDWSMLRWDWMTCRERGAENISEQNHLSLGMLH